MSLDEKTRTMSRSGSFRDGFEEGKRRLKSEEIPHGWMDGWMENSSSGTVLSVWLIDKLYTAIISWYLTGICESL